MKKQSMFTEVVLGASKIVGEVLTDLKKLKKDPPFMTKKGGK